MPSDFSTASDKSTPLRLTNHAIMALFMVEGEKVALPFAAPAVYEFQGGELRGGTAEDLADQVLSSLKMIGLEENALSRLVAHHADGQYQASGFLKKLKESLPAGTVLEDMPDDGICFVVPWNLGHWMNLAVVEVRDKSDCELLTRFIKRSDKFHTMFGRGRGHDEYFGVAEDGGLKTYEAQVYATTRFTSSAFSQFRTIYKGYEGYVTVYTEMRETEDDCEQMKYMVKGRDYCLDLCGIIDVFAPVVNMMTKGQSLSHLLWASTKWWPKLRGAILVAEAEHLRMQAEDAQ